MKKCFLLSTLLLIAFMAQAQSLKVVPTMKKGDVKNYAYAVKLNVAGKEVNISFDASFTVSNETPDGFEVTYRTNSLASDVGNDFVGHMLVLASEMMNNTDIIVITDKDGQVKGIKNFAEVKELMGKSASALVDEMQKNFPEMANVMPGDALKERLLSSITEKDLVNSMLQSSNPMVLNGKTIATGAQDEYVNDQNMKMKRMYFVNGSGKITATASINMSKDELKQFIIKKVEESAPDQAEMIKQNIDMVIASGVMKFDSTEKANYELGADGWMKTITVEGDTNAMGQKITTNTTVTLK